MAMRTSHTLLFNASVLLGGTVIVIAATLWPFNFQFRRLTGLEYFSSFAWAPSSIRDFPENVLLFLPFGLGLAALFRKFGRPLLLTLIAAFFATLAVESLQIFLAQRTANVSDLVANTLGALIGYASLRLWQERRALPLFCRAQLVPRNIAAAFAAWLALMLLLAWTLMWGIRPNGWDPSYRLAIGNELTADRPWRGTVHDLVILDRAADGVLVSQLLVGEVPSASGVVARYALGSKNRFRSETQGLPELLSQACVAGRANPGEDKLGPANWYATAEPVGSVSKAINKSGQFTIALTVASSDPSQAGPARIVTISEDAFHRNITLGQSGTSLALRWRSVFAKENGATPELQFPNVFAASHPQRVVISSDGNNIRFFSTAALGSHLFLGPEAGLASILHEDRYWAVEARPWAFWLSSLITALIMFFPLGFLVGIAVPFAKRLTGRALLISGLFVPSLAIEFFVSCYGRGPFRLANVAVGIFMASIGFASAVYCDCRLNRTEAHAC